MERLFGEVLTEAEHHADLRAREEDLTPRGVVHSVLAAFDRYRIHTSWVYFEPRRILDVCAGYGAWSSEARRIWPEAKITAVELDERKEPHLLKWADEVLVGVDWTLALDPRVNADEGHYDLAIGNPHFSRLVGDSPDESMPALLLEKCQAVLLFHQGANFQRGRGGARVWEQYPPAAVFEVPGAVRFRVGKNPATGKAYGSDSRCYQATLWVPGHTGPARLYQLPWLSAEDRRWTVHPGSEEPSIELPAAPGWEGQR